MQVYLVGGAVRDRLLGYPYHERDWVVVGATPQQLLDLGYQQVGNDFPVFLHPKTKEEYALARTERKNGKGYNGFDCYSAPDVSLEQDLQRRDLTINAIAEDEQGQLIDPYQGQQDIEKKLLRHVSMAFSEDPLRVLRTARFFARYYHLGFQIAPETLQLMTTISQSGELQHLSRERIWKETERALTEQSPEHYFIALQHCQALAVLFPMFDPLNTQSFVYLKRAVSHQATSLLRFALLFYQLPHPTLAQSLKQLKVPNDFAELAQIINQFAPLLLGGVTSGEQLLTLFSEADVYRRPNRFQQLLDCCCLIEPSFDSAIIQRALQRCLAIDVGAIVAQGLTGKAIGDALKQQRLTALKEQLDL